MKILSSLLLRARLAVSFALNPWRVIRQLREDNDRLVKTISNPTLMGVEIGNGTLGLELQGIGPKLLAGMFLGFLEKHPNAKNYLEFGFESVNGPVLVTVQRPGGQSPHQLRLAAEHAQAVAEYNLSVAEERIALLELERLDILAEQKNDIDEQLADLELQISETRASNAARDQHPPEQKEVKKEIHERA